MHSTRFCEKLCSPFLKIVWLFESQNTEAIIFSSDGLCIFGSSRGWMCVHSIDCHFVSGWKWLTQSSLWFSKYSWNPMSDISLIWLDWCAFWKGERRRGTHGLEIIMMPDSWCWSLSTILQSPFIRPWWKPLFTAVVAVAWRPELRSHSRLIIALLNFASVFFTENKDESSSPN